MQDNIYTVSEISNRINTVIEQYLPPIWVEGEVSNYYKSRAGHIYFSLKDENSVINCVFWSYKADRLSFKIEDGMNLLVSGNITTYKAQSEYQINVDEIKTAGKGKLYLAFQKLKEKLKKEGLFKEELKKDIPKFPTKIGVVTSAEGAAITDILNVSKRRNPSIEFIIYPSMVQGDTAHETIIEGIKTFNKRNNVDLIIIGRGGGSLEDLWAFNEEELIREIVNSDIPIVSAVGHEVDYTLSDFAADKRAPTPSAAAEITVPARSELITQINNLQERLNSNINRLIKRNFEKIDYLKKRLIAQHPEEFIQQNKQKVDDLERQLIRNINNKLERKSLEVENLKKNLKSLNPREVLNRGYSIIYKKPDLNLVKKKEQVEKEDEIKIEVSNGKFNAKVTS